MIGFRLRNLILTHATPGEPKETASKEVILRAANLDQSVSRDFKFIIRDDGVWQVSNDDELAIVETVANDSDRAVAIIAANMIESRIDGALLAIAQRDKEVEARLFQPSGPIGSFSTKIDLLFFLKFISRDAHKDLMILKNIRNKFAHDLSVRDFNSIAIRDRTINLRLYKDYASKFDPEKGVIVNLTHPYEKPFLFVENYQSAKTDPKARYLLTVQLFLVAFAKLIFPGKFDPII